LERSVSSEGARIAPKILLNASEISKYATTILSPVTRKHTKDAFILVLTNLIAPCSGTPSPGSKRSSLSRDFASDRKEGDVRRKPIDFWAHVRPDSPCPRLGKTKTCNRNSNGFIYVLNQP
jgi:hypothetical protein